MKRIIILITTGAVLAIMPGCVSKGVIDSYEAYLDTAGKEHMQYVEAGKFPDGTAMSEADKASRKLNYESSRKVIKKAREQNASWNWLNWGGGE